MKKSTASVRTIQDFVAVMGGTKDCAKWLGVGDSYVSNMLARGYLPGGFHMRVFVEMKRRGLEVAPELFDLQADDGEFLRALGASRKRRPLARARRHDQRPAA